MKSASTRLPDPLAVQRICELVKHRFGLAPADTTAFRRRLTQLTQELNCSLEELYVRVTRQERIPVEKLIQACTVNHTGFYREVSTYHRFMEHVVPTLPAEGPIRVWSAASSSGEELYTLAFFLVGAFGLDEVADRWQLLGTDIDARMIQKAERAVYPEQRLLHTPHAIRERFFRLNADATYRVHDSIRRLCTFRRLNLLRSRYPFEKSFHAILCRNVLYYFTPEIQSTVLRSLHRVGRSGGWLLTGASESIHHLDTPWERITQGLHRRVA